ncbi:trigger factor [Candidatus Laterigemmans baculatus]|uniref:trigger factor n=1 Tax=Candidatus Laterigemmans baculatus TaxID=2770505 RepID=UPI0013D99EDB|nr:trigger factor [Candidatus Laterigemmans baculatus]
MSTSDLQSDSPVASEGEKTPLKLDIKVDSPQACLRHVVVTIPHAEVERYMRDAYDELVPEAQVPGFRAGRAPRKLVEKQFRDRVSDQVKSSLLMDSLSQVTDSAEFSAISEPDFDYESIELPEGGDFRYEFKVEVRPEFETPNWKELKLTRPSEEITDEAVEKAVKGLLGRNAQAEATDEPAAEGDSLLLTARFLSDGRVISEMDEERVQLTDRLSFSDGVCDNFGEALQGAREGDTRKAKVKISAEAPREDMRGKELDAEFTVVEVSRKQLPELTESYLREIGDFDSKEEFYEFVRSSLQRQVVYRQEQALRKQIVENLIGDAEWELPPDLVRRQTRRELDRKILELRRSGFDDDTVRRLVNTMRQNAQTQTEASLREHFVLEQIAEDEKVDATAEDYQQEIELIAEQSDMPVRRVRARLEKSGQMDALRNQIVERKVIEMITAAAEVSDEPQAEGQDDKEFAVYHNVLGTKETDSIPEAKHEDKSPKEKEEDKKKP